MRKHFEIDHAAYHLLDDETSAASKTAMHLLGSKEATSGPVRSHELSSLFGADGGDGSAAVAIVSHRSGPKAVIAVGSADATRYSAADGTMFLEYLATIIGSLPMPSAPANDPSTEESASDSVD